MFANISKLYLRLYNQSKSIVSLRSYSEHRDPLKRTWKILSNEIPTLFGKSNETVNYPEHSDIVVIGSGFIGAAVAYWLKTRAADGLSVVVLEKDFDFKDTQKSLRQSVLTQHFSLPENIYLSRYSAEFLRNIKEHLGSNIDIDYCPTGSLILASEKYAENLEHNVSIQKEHGLKNELLTTEDINKLYPWINTQDIALGCTSIESEGIYDAWALLEGLVRKCKEMGTTFVNAEVIGFEMEKQRDMLMEGVAPGSFERINRVVYRTPDNVETRVKFAVCVLAAGAESGNLAKLVKIGTGDGMLNVPLPIDKRPQNIYSVESKLSTGICTPIVMDTSGLWLKKGGFQNNLVCGHVPLISEEFKNLTDDEFYRDIVKPSLLNRVPNFIDAKINKINNEIYDCNTYDESGILGPHPYHNNLYIAAGFGKLGCQHALGIGRGIAELIIDSQYTTIDLTRFGFDRFLTNETLIDFNVY